MIGLGTQLQRPQTCFEPSFGSSSDSGVFVLDVESLCSGERTGRDGNIVFKSRKARQI